MDIGEIVAFWRGQQQHYAEDKWAHQLDRKVLDADSHSFNLNHPVSPYVGDILNAPVIILGANAKYDRLLTPAEFPSDEACASYIGRVDKPDSADWSFVSHYYNDTNYGDLVASGQVALINACAYRSPKISEETDNQKMIARLPSCIFTRRWLLEAILPMAKKGERLIVINRGGQWRLPLGFAAQNGVSKDPAPVNAKITGSALKQMTDYLARHQ